MFATGELDALLPALSELEAQAAETRRNIGDQTAVSSAKTLFSKSVKDFYTYNI